MCPSNMFRSTRVLFAVGPIPRSLLQRSLLLIIILAVNARGNASIIRLNGYLEDGPADGAVRSVFRIMATPDKISASLQRKILGAKNQEAVDIDAEFKIIDTNFVDEWRRLALVAFLQSSERRKKTAMTRLPNGYWAINVENPPLSSPGDSASGAPSNDVSMQLVTTTLSALNQMIARKEYQQISLSRSEGDTVPAVPTSVGRILADPRKWDGRRVKVTGWFSHGEEKSVIYPSRFYAWMGKKGIWVGESSTIATGLEEYPEKYEGHREIEGVVRASLHGHLGGFPCTIDRLTINRVSSGKAEQ